MATPLPWFPRSGSQDPTQEASELIVDAVPQGIRNASISLGERAFQVVPDTFAEAFPVVSNYIRNMLASGALTIIRNTAAYFNGQTKVPIGAIGFALGVGKWLLKGAGDLGIELVGSDVASGYETSYLRAAAGAVASGVMEMTWLRMTGLTSWAGSPACQGTVDAMGDSFTAGPKTSISGDYMDDTGYRWLPFQRHNPLGSIFGSRSVHRSHAPLLYGYNTEAPLGSTTKWAVFPNWRDTAGFFNSAVLGVPAGCASTYVLKSVLKFVKARAVATGLLLAPDVEPGVSDNPIAPPYGDYPDQPRAPSESTRYLGYPAVTAPPPSRSDRELPDLLRPRTTR